MRNLLIFISILYVILCSCGRNSSDVDPVLPYILQARYTNPYALPGDAAPDAGCTRLRTYRPTGGGKLFNDLNDAHLRHARSGGIRPIVTSTDVWLKSKGIVAVRSDSTLYIDSLTHSFAYLTPAAAGVLREIGHRFNDSLDARGGGDYRIKVTSLLRTNSTVGRLRRVNRNATVESAHRYATTFDISYSKFICDNARGTRRSFDDLSALLAEIVADLRAEGRCLVKRERKQACFHITVSDNSQSF